MNTIPPRARFIAPRLWLAVAFCSIAAALASLALAGAGAAGWAVIASPNGADSTGNALQNVTCVSASDCWAVGFFASSSSSGPLRTLIQHWDGASWSVVPSPNAVATGSFPGNQLSDVTCSSASECWAVGTYTDQDINRTLILRWNGSSWSIVPSPNATPGNNFLGGVACTSANECWAVGASNAAPNGLSATLIQRWNGSAWSIVPSPNYSDTATTSNDLSSVTCTSASDCWAVGGYSDILENGGSTLIARWNGTDWSLVPSPNTGPDDINRLGDVTCSSASDCWAVGLNFPFGDQRVFRTLIQRWNGSAWALVPSGVSDRGFFLGSVTCPAAAECWAVGTHIERWDGNSWSLFPSPAGGSGVTCSSTAECWAVSQTQEDAGSSKTLILRYGAFPVQASAAVSRKTHGGAPFDINLPLTGAPGIESRSSSVNNDHQVVLTFPGAVSFASADVTSGAGNVSNTSGSGTAQVTVNLTGVTDAQTITLTLFGVNDGMNTNDVVVPMGVLLGDTSADRVVNSADITQTRRESGQAASLSNFRADTSLDGVINSADITTVRRASGTSLPSP